MTYSHPLADCLYTGISSGVWAQRSVTSMGSLYLFTANTSATANATTSQDAYHIVEMLSLVIDLYA